MIAYTAWDSLRAIAQQYNADLVLAPGERLGLTRRRDQSVPRATLRRLGKRLRAGLAGLHACSIGRARIGVFARLWEQRMRSFGDRSPA